MEYTDKQWLSALIEYYSIKEILDELPFWMFENCKEYLHEKVVLEENLKERLKNHEL